MKYNFDIYISFHYTLENMFELPNDFKQLITDFSEQYIIDRPHDIIEYAADYFEKLQIYRRKYLILGGVETARSPSSWTKHKSYPGEKYYFETGEAETSFTNVSELSEDESSETPKDYTYLYNLLSDQLPIFESISTNLIDYIIERIMSRKVVAGQTILEAGKIEENLYIVEDGIFHAIVSEEGNINKIIYVYTHRGCFGRKTVCEPSFCRAKVVASTNGTLWVIKGDIFEYITEILNRARENVHKYKKK